MPENQVAACCCPLLDVFRGQECETQMGGSDLMPDVSDTERDPTLLKNRLVVSSGGDVYISV